MNTKTKLNESNREFVHSLDGNNYQIRFSHPINGTKRVGKTLKIRSGTQKITLTGRDVTALKELLNNLDA